MSSCGSGSSAGQYCKLSAAQLQGAAIKHLCFSIKTGLGSRAGSGSIYAALELLLLCQRQRQTSAWCGAMLCVQGYIRNESGGMFTS